MNTTAVSDRAFTFLASSNPSGPDGNPMSSTAKSGWKFVRIGPRSSPEAIAETE
jgi:hypothetical protein